MQIVCRYINEEIGDDSILVINCSFDEQGCIDISKSIDGRLSEDGVGFGFKGIPTNDDIKLTWDTGHHSDILKNLISIKIQEGIKFTRVPPTKDNAWEYVITQVNI